MSKDKLVTVECVSVRFVENRCNVCGRDWECYQTDPFFICDDCYPKVYPPVDLDDGQRPGDDK